jgi:hypothetical protein
VHCIVTASYDDVTRSCRAVIFLHALTAAYSTGFPQGSLARPVLQWTRLHCVPFRRNHHSSLTLHRLCFSRTRGFVSSSLKSTGHHVMSTREINECVRSRSAVTTEELHFQIRACKENAGTTDGDLAWSRRCMTNCTFKC